MNSINTLQPASRAREYLDLWVNLISEYLSSLVHASVTAETVVAEDSSRNAREGSDAGVWMNISADSASGQTFFLSGKDALQLAQLLGNETAGPGGKLSSDVRKAVGGFFSQIAARIPVANWLGIDTGLTVSESKRPEWASSFEAAYRFSTPQGSSLVLLAQVGTEFASALQSATETDKEERKTHPAISLQPFRAAPEALRDGRLELLMDVELEVVLRFGQREMLLRDVLNLTPGTVLELDQQVHDPVELLVGNKVIAWGEVVAIDGNYGLRITSLASRKERLESLRK